MMYLRLVVNLGRKIFTYCVYMLSHLFPRSKDIWVFIGWHNGKKMEVFADNTKYLFLYITENQKNIQAVWLAKDKKLASLLRSKGFTSYSYISLRGIWYALRAGTTIIDAYFQPKNFRFSGRTRLIQLLHGKGMKKGGYAQKPRRHQNYIFSTSPFVSEMLPSIFVQKSPTIVAGYPRSDVFLKKIRGSDIGTDEQTKKMLSNPQYNKKFLYAPTFRRGIKTLDIEQILNLLKMSEWLKKNSYLLVISLHPKYSNQTRSLSYDNIHFVEDSDIYPLLPLIDILIVDYGSTFTDFLLLDRPIIFYPYDLEEYEKKEGFSFDDYNTYTPGAKAYSPSELILIIEQTLYDDSYINDRVRVRNLYHTYTDGKSSQRITDILNKNK